MPLPVEDEKELAVGGFQGIAKIRGLIVNIDVVDPPDSWERRPNEPLKQVVRVDMEDTAVLEMFGDEDIFELKDGKFSFFVPYVVSGRNPHQNSIYSRCWLASAKELGKKPSEFIGQYVTLEKQARLLFQKPVLEDDGTGKKSVVLDEEGKKVLEDILSVNESGRPNHFCFVADETADAENIKEYIRDLVSGLNEKAALRELLVNTRAKQFPEFKIALNGGTLGKMLDLEVVDGKFQRIEDADSSSEIS